MFWLAWALRVLLFAQILKPRWRLHNSTQPHRWRACLEHCHISVKRCNNWQNRVRRCRSCNRRHKTDKMQEGVQLVAQWSSSVVNARSCGCRRIIFRNLDAKATQKNPVNPPMQSVYFLFFHGCFSDWQFHKYHKPQLIINDKCSSRGFINIHIRSGHYPVIRLRRRKTFDRLSQSWTTLLFSSVTFVRKYFARALPTPYTSEEK